MFNKKPLYKLIAFSIAASALFTLSGCDSDPVDTDGTEKDTKKDALAAYSPYLSDMYPNSYMKFGIAYLDDNDVPELLTTHGMAHLNRVAIYTYSDGEIVRINLPGESESEYGTYGEIVYIERGNCIAGGNGGSHGIFSSTYMEIDDNEMIITDNCIEDTNNGTYTVNDEPADYDEYQEVIDKYNSDDFKSSFDIMQDLTEENIDALLDD